MGAPARRMHHPHRLGPAATGVLARPGGWPRTDVLRARGMYASAEDFRERTGWGGGSGDACIVGIAPGVRSRSSARWPSTRPRTSSTPIGSGRGRRDSTSTEISEEHEVKVGEANTHTIERCEFVCGGVVFRDVFIRERLQ
eukprot:scaffold19235_cov126-Isochrysis_galbana.AAC.1